MPEVLKKISDAGEKLGFVFIDGDHSTEGVKADINSLLYNYVPVCDLVVVFHDSFNPVCRKGILEADWHKNPYVHYVDIDYVPGNFYKDNFGAAKAGSLWNGLSFALLKAEKRTGKLQVRQTLKNTYEQMYKATTYAAMNTPYRRFRKTIKMFLKGGKK